MKKVMKKVAKKVATKGKKAPFKKPKSLDELKAIRKKRHGI